MRVDARSSPEADLVAGHDRRSRVDLGVDIQTDAVASFEPRWRLERRTPPTFATGSIHISCPIRTTQPLIPQPSSTVPPCLMWSLSSTCMVLCRKMRTSSPNVTPPPSMRTAAATDAAAPFRNFSSWVTTPCDVQNASSCGTPIRAPGAISRSAPPITSPGPNATSSAIDFGDRMCGSATNQDVRAGCAERSRARGHGSARAPTGGPVHAPTPDDR